MDEARPITITLNGQRVETTEGRYLLEVCREQGVEIPTLCHHESVTPAGACRLCSVEVQDGKGWSRVVVSCIYPCWDGMIVITDSPRVVGVRRLVLETLLARCPRVPLIQNLARQYGIRRPRFSTENHECILCGLCVRVCSEVVGVHALSMQGRGADKECGIPYPQVPSTHTNQGPSDGRTTYPSSTCIGCGACVYICPTECIHMTDRDGVRTIWHEEAGVKTSVRTFALRYCKTCGTLIGPDAQLRFIREKGNLPEDFHDLCIGCRAIARRPAAAT